MDMAQMSEELFSKIANVEKDLELLLMENGLELHDFGSHSLHGEPAWKIKITHVSIETIDRLKKENKS